MRGIILILAVLAASPAAAKCHLFSVWHYPWPQRCFGQKPVSVRHEALADIGGLAEIGGTAALVSPGRGPSGPADIPLPSLARADLDGGEADEAARGRLLLRATLEAPR